MSVLVIGGGGREHAICWSLAKSKKVNKIYCLPGNAGIAEIAECHDIGVMEFDKIANFIAEHADIDLTIVAPDDPLAGGLVNLLTAKGYRVFGPTKEAAIIEASKVFSKYLMKKYDIPTADYAEFTDFELAKSYISKAKFPLVIKADGLALGKGVIICENLAEGIAALKEMMIDKKFSGAADKIIVEEFLVGKEVSLLCFTDGTTTVSMVSAQDHKRAHDNDTGLNTGGMGTFAPSKLYTKEIDNYVQKNIILPTIEAMKSENREFKGVLYFGLMLTSSGVKVLEYNARFGDPETQVILPLLKTDIYDIFNSVVDGTLDKQSVEWENKSCVCVILASGGYPESYQKGKKIEIDKLDKEIMLFHAGTKMSNGVMVTCGGRVIGVTSCGTDIDEARDNAYANIEKVKFENSFYRHDIGIKK